MADNRPERPREAGDRDRDQRLQARRLQERQDRWAVPDDDARRAHRRSRQPRTRRTR
jgi:hypothetical protein